MLPARSENACFPVFTVRIGPGPEGQERVEAVRKLGEILRLVEQSEICRDFFASKRSEGSKKRTKIGPYENAPEFSHGLGRKRSRLEKLRSATEGARIGRRPEPAVGQGNSQNRRHFLAQIRNQRYHSSMTNATADSSRPRQSRPIRRERGERP